MRAPRFTAFALALGLLSPGLAAANEVEAFPEASKVVAIGGSLTEVVYALGEEKRLVARDSTSLYPDAVFQLPDVGYMRQLSPEGVLSVNPDAILMLAGSGPPEAVDVLKKASVPLVFVPDEFSREGIVAKVKAVGKALGVEEKADKLAASVDADIAAAEKAAAAMPVKKKVLFVLSLQGGKILAAGTGTGANGIIEMAGGENVMAGFKGYKQVTDEAIITAQPDVVLMMDRGSDHSTIQQQVLEHPALVETPAGKAKRLVHMDGTYLIGFGPRTAGAVRDLSAALAAQ